MIIEILIFIVFVYLLYLQHQDIIHRNEAVVEHPDPILTSIQKPIASTPVPAVIATKTTDDCTTLEVTPVWFEPVKLPPASKVKLPPHFRRHNPTEVRTYDCLSMYRSMKSKTQMIDFVAEPFKPSVDNTETIVVVLNELVHHLGFQLSFTEKAFDYDDSNYRTACGVSNLGSIHSILASGQSSQTAMFKLHMNLNYADIASSQDNLRNLTVNLINDLSTVVGVQKEFIRVFSISRASSIYVDIGITTPEFEETRKLAERLKASLNRLKPEQKKSILGYLLDDKYDYFWKPTLNYLQLQESDLDPRFNRNYTHPQEETRGGHPYYFPQGWYRHALKVENKYPDDRVWLGMDNSPGEWRVAYHGTKHGVVKSITDTGLQHRFVTADICKEEAESSNPHIPKVKGLYVATHCENGASLYSQSFQIDDQSANHKKYCVVFQCRVQNGKYTEHKGPVNTGLALRVFDEKAIRPYGILLKEG